MLNPSQIKLYLGNVTQLNESDSQMVLIVITPFVLNDPADLLPLGIWPDFSFKKKILWLTFEKN